MFNLSRQQIAKINKLRAELAAMVADGECVYEMQDYARLEGTQLQVIATALIIIEQGA